MTFFDKMSCRRARVKIKIGMVTFSHPCVHVYITIYIMHNIFFKNRARFRLDIALSRLSRYKDIQAIADLCFDFS